MNNPKAKAQQAANTKTCIPAELQQLGQVPAALQQLGPAIKSTVAQQDVLTSNKPSTPCSRYQAMLKSVLSVTLAVQ